MPRWLGVVLRIAGTAAGFIWIGTQLGLHKTGEAFERIPLGGLVVAVALVAGNVVIGALRWRATMHAYGATEIPPLPRLIGLYFTAFFYNNYLPGAVAGDVARGVITRGAFAKEGATGALAVVWIERALGLLALFVLLAIGVATVGVPASSAASLGLSETTIWWWTALGGAGSVCLVLAIAGARYLAPRLPRAMQLIAGKIPALVNYRAFGAAMAWSLGTQLLVALAGWVLLAGLYPIGFLASLLVVPLAAATTFLPITVGGAGAREAVYVALCGPLFGMAKEQALAASLGLWLAHLIVGAGGKVAELVTRRPAT